MKIDPNQSKTTKTPAILGVFEGECADAKVTNLNGLDITRDVWKYVFASDDYKKAIKLGHYIGFLGHPDDPGCMDFEHACIVMTDGYIDDNGIVHGKFNLVDTPVGRIVKAFIDAGVTFGISVRGAGDISHNSVVPETFVFRGFDLVTFPAYPNSIPTFTEIAASSDAKIQQKYKNICAAINTNLPRITNVGTLTALQSQFAAQSVEYKKIEARKQSLTASTDVSASMSSAQLQSMTKLYISASKENAALKSQIQSLQKQLKSSEINANRQIQSIRRITAVQTHDLQAKNRRLEAQCSMTRTQRDEITANQSLTARKHDAIQADQEVLQKTLASTRAKLVEANRQIVSLRASLDDSQNCTDELASNCKDQDLKYRQKIDSMKQELHEKDLIISDLHKQLDETVNDATDADVRSSNIDANNKKLRAQVEAALNMLAQYQDAYAHLYASAIGADMTKSVTISESTSVTQLQKLIAATNTCNVPASLEPLEDSLDYEDDSDGLITV